MYSKLETGWYDADGLGTYLALPAGHQMRPLVDGGVLMLPMITGIGEQLRDWANSVATTLKQTVLVWDPWHGPNSENSSIAVLREHLSNLDDESALNEIERLLEHMKGRLGIRRISVIGWCLGGRYALLTGARNPGLAGVVSMHPTLPASESDRGEYDAAAAAVNIDAPVVVHYPGQDHIVSRESFNRLQTSLQTRTDETSILAVHPRAHHGFSDRKNHDDPDNAAAFALAWPQVLAFLNHTTSSPVRATSVSEGNNNA